MASGYTGSATNLRGVTFASDASELIGYRICRCGAYVLELMFEQLGHQCWECYQVSPFRAHRTLDILHAGRVSSVRVPPPRKKGSRGSKGSRSTRSIRKYAERAALVRLKAMFPEAYELLYAEERIRRGLPVVPRRGTTTSAEPATYHAALDRGEP